MTHEFIGKKVLVTVEDWFYGGDGQMYKAIWGELKAIKKVDDLIGFATTRAHANWVYEIGDTVISGCRINYIVKCEKKPKTKGHKNYVEREGKCVIFTSPNAIYITE